MPSTTYSEKPLTYSVETWESRGCLFDLGIYGVDFSWNSSDSGAKSAQRLRWIRPHRSNTRRISGPPLSNGRLASTRRCKFRGGGGENGRLKSPFTKPTEPFGCRSGA